MGSTAEHPRRVEQVSERPGKEGTKEAGPGGRAHWAEEDRERPLLSGPLGCHPESGPLGAWCSTLCSAAPHSPAWHAAPTAGPGVVGPTHPVRRPLGFRSKGKDQRSRKVTHLRRWRSFRPAGSRRFHPLQFALQPDWDRGGGLGRNPRKEPASKSALSPLNTPPLVSRQRVDANLPEERGKFSFFLFFSFSFFFFFFFFKCTRIANVSSEIKSRVFLPRRSLPEAGRFCGRTDLHPITQFKI
nr:uncharacterized protein LOC119627634 [Chlorocebus sabaeus]